MKLLLLFFVCLLATCPFCRAQTDAPVSSTNVGFRAAYQIKFLLKERTLWNGSNNFCSANFSYSRAVAQVSDVGMCRTSSYVLPLLYGLRFNPAISFEGGFFGGVNRHRLVENSMFGRPDGVSQTTLAYGLLLGMAHKIQDGVDFKLRYRHDLDNSYNAWQPLQAGLSFSF